MTKALVVDGSRAQSAAVRLLIVPHAGAGAAAGMALRRALPPDWCAGVVRLAGREVRFAEPVGTFDDQLHDIRAAVDHFPGDAPLLLLGACSGAVLAFEAARAAERHQPGFVHGVIALSRAAPVAPAGVGPAADLASPEALLASGAVAPELVGNPEFVAHMVPILQADTLAVESYRAATTPPLRAPLLAVRGTEDIHCSAADLDTWTAFAESARATTVPGGHFLLTDAAVALSRALVSNMGFLLGTHAAA